jgi:ferritin
VTLAQLNQQEQTVRKSIEKLSEVQEQIRDMQR